MQHCMAGEQDFSLAMSQHTLCTPVPWQTCGFLNMLYSLSSWGFCQWCSLPWFICLDIVFFIFKTLLKHHLLTYADFPRQGQLLPPPCSQIALYTYMSVKVLIVTTSDIPESVFQLVSDPLHCMDCSLCFFVSRCLILFLVGLRNTFWITTFSLWTIVFLAHINEIIAIKYHLHLGKRAHCFLFGRVLLGFIFMTTLWAGWMGGKFFSVT